MTSMLFFISFSSIIFGTSCLATEPCDINNGTCVLETFKKIHKMIAEGIPSMCLAKLDPIYKDKLIGTFPTFNYTFTNAEFKGLKKCEVKDVKINIDQAEFSLNILCPRTIIRGHYEISGEVLSLPIQGNGCFSITSNDLNLTYNAYYGRIKEEDGKEHYVIKDFKQVVNSKSKVIYDFKNLYNGDQKKADRMQKVANENWKILSESAEGPRLYAFLNVYLSNINKYLGNIPANQLFITQ